MLSAALVLAPASVAATPGAASKVSVGSPADETPRNHQNEPAVAIDAHNPDVVVAASNDYIDAQRCPRALVAQNAQCIDFSEGVDQGIGITGVYFSFDHGQNWTQPTYTGWTARDCGSETVCPGHLGPIGTVPWYWEAGAVSGGDPALAIGPRPVDGRFSWANGSRLYVGNRVDEFPGRDAFAGTSAIGVSRLDNPTPERVAAKSNWMPPVFVDPHQSRTEFEDKDQVWADNAASSPYFGRAYVCETEFRSNGGHGPKQTFQAPLKIGTSVDGGDTWQLRQETPATGSATDNTGWGYVGCTIRTDSHGVVYVFVAKSGAATSRQLPAKSEHTVIQSFDGGIHWTKPRPLFPATDLCFFVDPLSGRCVMDGLTGARTELGSAPTVDIANGAPTGADATNVIIDAWADARAGLNNEQTLISWSADGAQTWSTPTTVSLPGDRPLYAAPAISPPGDRAYVVYQAVTSPWRGSDLSSPRPYHGVLLTAPMSAAGPGAWTTAYAGPLGDLRGTYPGHRLSEERVGDYVYAAASRTNGVGVWTDARDAAVCPAIQGWRAASLAALQVLVPAPWPPADCPSTFGNTDIWAATGA